MKDASCIQQLLKDLIIGSELETGRNTEAITPKFEGSFQWLGREGSGDAKVKLVACFTDRGIHTVEIGEGHTDKFQVMFPRLVKEGDVTNHSLCIIIRSRSPCRTSPQCFGEIDRPNLNRINRLQDEGLAFLDSEDREQLSD